MFQRPEQQCYQISTDAINHFVNHALHVLSGTAVLTPHLAESNGLGVYMDPVQGGPALSSMATIRTACAVLALLLPIDWIMYLDHCVDQCACHYEHRASCIAAIRHIAVH